MSYLVVGVGGTGRGCLVWLKELLKREWPKFYDQFAFLLVDGPDRDDAYSLPGGVTFDSSSEPGNCYPLTRNPQDVLDRIRDTRSDSEAIEAHRFIGTWLRGDSARRIDAQSVNPTHGFGQSRLPGRANFFLEAPHIYTRLKNLAANRRIVFLVGSLVGGTGAGQLIDLAAVLREATPDGTNIILITALAGGFNAVFRSLTEQVNRDTRCFAGLRELYRMAGDKNWPQAYHIKYEDTLTATNPKLFNLCFLLDGRGAQTNEAVPHPVSPVLGICNEAALGIIHMSLCNSFLTGDLTQWVQKPMNYPKQMSSFGVHAYIYSPEQVLEFARLRFALEFHERISSDIAMLGGIDHADDVLKVLPMTALTLLQAKGRPLPIDPPVHDVGPLSALLGSYRGSPDNHLQMSHAPCLDLEEEVRNKPGFLGLVGGMDNEDLISACQSRSDSYIGRPSDPGLDNLTVYDYVNRENGRIRDEFVKLLLERIKSIFYDTKGEKPVPFSLADRPNALFEAAGLLAQVIERLNALKGLIEERRDANNRVRLDAQENLGKCQQQLGQETKRNLRAQDEYKAAAQRFLRLRAWDALLDGMISGLQAMLKEAMRLWELIGDPAVGWCGYINEMKKIVQNLHQSQLTHRENLKENLAYMRYLPRPRTESELAMYVDFVTKPKHLETFMQDCCWSFVKTADDAADDEATSYDLQLTVPGIEGAAGEDAELTQLQEMFTQEVHQRRVSSYSWLTPARYLEARIKKQIEGLSIFDAFGYDYEQWKRKYASDNPSIERYVTNKVSNAENRAKAALEVRGENKGEESRGILTCNSAAPETAGGQRMRNAFSQHLAKVGGVLKVTDDPLFSKSFVSFSYLRGLQLEDWKYYSKALEHYIKHVDDDKVEPMHAQPEEQIARRIERFCIDRKQVPETFLLSTSVTRFLASRDDFALFTFAWLYDLFDTADDPNDLTAPKQLLVKTTTAGAAAELILGNEDQIGKLLTTFLGAGNDVYRDEIRRRWRDKQKELLTGGHPAFAADLEKKAATAKQIRLVAARPNMEEVLDRDHLRLAMWVMVEDLRQRLLTPQERTSA